MTDKQIIIDDVNVRDCTCIIEDYYYQQANNLANGYKHIKNVCELGESGSEYYKLFCKDNPNCYYKQLKCKEQECEELKKIIQRHDNDNNALLKEVEDKLCEYYRRYRECITDIKEIAENREIFCENCTGGVEDFTCNDCGYVKILQKISECKGEYNEKIR